MSQVHTVESAYRADGCMRSLDLEERMIDLHRRGSVAVLPIGMKDLHGFESRASVDQLSNCDEIAVFIIHAAQTAGRPTIGECLPGGECLPSGETLADGG